WGKGFAPGESAVLWSQKSLGTQSPGGHYSWKDVREYFYEALTSGNKVDRDENYAQTFRGLGQLMHMVQDMSVPEHTRDDGHYIGTLGYTHYEQWVKKHPQMISTSTPGYFDKSTLRNNNPPAPVPIANLFDTNQYTGSNPAVTVNNDTIGLSEYTNANFLSPDTIFSADFTYPNKGDCIPFLDTDNIRLYLSSRGDGENIDHLAVFSFLRFWRNMYFPQVNMHMPFRLDSSCYEEYASKLIPRAVGYSAGILDYFFRGELGVETFGGLITITNKTTSQETMQDGQFELYYDDENDNRHALTIDSGAAVTSLAFNGTQEITFTVPSEPVRYILVYRGGLGNEADAVVGKIRKVPKSHLLVKIISDDIDPQCFVWDAEYNQYAQILKNDGSPASFPCNVNDISDWINSTESIGE
ncbi:MAG: hypothetical protein GY845_07135, partial [Planctomycetes bacterium]|nr:hypothetical protein [Planctomycetota bacterium]